MLPTMNNERIDKWVSLLSEVEMLPSSISQGEPISTINSENDDFIAYEARTGIRFSEDYKAFCKTFGQGCFGNGWISIYASNKNTIDDQIAHQKDVFYAFESYLHYGGNTEFVPTLNESYFFGALQGVIFIFSKDALEKESLYSHIYAIDEDGNIYDFGKDFFEFVKTCCLNKEIERRFPSLLIHMVSLDMTIDQLVAPMFISLK